jgi:D-glycero-alpha-D-manno-heptose-7-phosphate kinase
MQAHHETTSYDTLEPRDGSEIAVAAVKYLGYKVGANFLISSDVQPGSGLGASSALTVNFVKTISTMKGENLSKEKLAETAFHIGRNILHYPIGKQDEYASAFGGFNYIKFGKDEVKVHPINIGKSTLLELQQNLLLFFVGNDVRNSTAILKSQLERIEQNQHDTINSLHFVKQLAEELYESLNKSDIHAFGELLHKSWVAKKKFAKNITNEHIDKIYELALKHGVVGGKLTGAGGGGHMLFYCELPYQEAFIQKMESLGLKQVKFNFHNEGPKVLDLYDFSR